MLDRNKIGHEFDPFTVEVERGQLRFFAKAIGETNSIYAEQSAARKVGYSDIPAPPTFLMALDLGGPDMPPVLKLLDMDIGRILHGSQEFEYFGDICAGDTITVTSKIVDMFDKKGGALEFVVCENSYTNQDGELQAKARQTLVYRNLQGK